ncbi:flavohemoprotein [Aquabacterium soli]|uniref:nitric oxide dioxygenase n=1 Tax=Aquabacterium soli TaxID=2493092 RepID=A0A426VAD4_9BURK|nr:globin domain-containing protein [Aquabacterium soli]RRS03875.1 flavohemoprotein [Aquabacterium soli]
MISTAARPYIEASVPVLREHGLAITTRFYARMFDAHPELNNLFNMGNQASGAQQQSLASAVFAYAANIDNAAALTPVLDRIVHKHAAVGLKPSHYPIVGRHLLAAIGEVLGEAATPELIAAWAEAYWLLAGELIAAEARLYERTGTQPGELQPLRVQRIEREGADTVSIYLQTADGARPGPFQPGQYVSVAMEWTEPGQTTPRRQLRQYSLSDAPDQPWWRLTVKREAGTPAGQVSNWLHDHVKAGDVLPVSAAYGDFTPVIQGDTPLVLLSAGVGITPMVSVLKAVAGLNPTRPVVFAHAARNAEYQALQADLRETGARMPALRTVLFHEQGTTPGVDTAGQASPYRGRMTLEPVLTGVDLGQAQVLMCGPLPFMREQWAGLLQRGVPATRIHREVFGPELLDHLL